MAISIGQRSSSLGSGKVEYRPDHPIVHFGSPAPACDTSSCRPGDRAAKRRAIEEFYGGEVPASTIDRLTLIDPGPDRTHPFVD